MIYNPPIWSNSFYEDGIAEVEEFTERYLDLLYACFDYHSSREAFIKALGQDGLYLFLSFEETILYYLTEITFRDKIYTLGGRFAKYKGRGF